MNGSTLSSMSSSSSSSLSSSSYLPMPQPVLSDAIDVNTQNTSQVILTSIHQEEKKRHDNANRSANSLASKKITVYLPRLKNCEEEWEKLGVIWQNKTPTTASREEATLPEGWAFDIAMPFSGSVLCDASGIPRARIFNDEWYKPDPSIEFFTEEEGIAALKQKAEEKIAKKEKGEQRAVLKGLILAKRSERWSEETPFGVFFIKKSQQWLGQHVYESVRRSCHGFFPTQELADQAKNWLENSVGYHRIYDSVFVDERYDPSDRTKYLLVDGFNDAGWFQVDTWSASAIESRQIELENAIKKKQRRQFIIEQRSEKPTVKCPFGIFYHVTLFGGGFRRSCHGFFPTAELAEEAARLLDYGIKSTKYVRKIDESNLDFVETFKTVNGFVDKDWHLSNDWPIENAKQKKRVAETRSETWSEESPFAVIMIILYKGSKRRFCLGFFPTEELAKHAAELLGNSKEYEVESSSVSKRNKDNFSLIKLRNFRICNGFTDEHWYNPKDWEEEVILQEKRILAERREAWSEDAPYAMLFYINFHAVGRTQVICHGFLPTQELAGLANALLEDAPYYEKADKVNVELLDKEDLKYLSTLSVTFVNGLTDKQWRQHL